MARERETRARLQFLIEELVTAGDSLALKTVENLLRLLLRSAIQTKHNKRFPELMGDAVHDFVRKAKKGKKQ